MEMCRYAVCQSVHICLLAPATFTSCFLSSPDFSTTFLHISFISIIISLLCTSKSLFSVPSAHIPQNLNTFFHTSSVSFLTIRCVFHWHAVKRISEFKTGTKLWNWCEITSDPNASAQQLLPTASFIS